MLKAKKHQYGIPFLVFLMRPLGLDRLGRRYGSLRRHFKYRTATSFETIEDSGCSRAGGGKHSDVSSRLQE